MLSLAHRFHGHNSLRPLYQKGRSVYSRNLKLLWLPTNSSYRVAVVVSKKVHKSAVVRNRIRRRVYTLTKNFIDEHNLSTDLVFLAQNAVLADMTPEAIQNEVASLLGKVGNTK